MTESLTSNQIFIRKLTEIVLADINNEKSCAKELAQESGISLYLVNRRLLKINGKTASQFIREVRFRKALV